jgi:tetratricopeptide (TPR) repeat protein
MALYKKAIAVKEPLVQSDRNNVEIQRLITFDKFGLGQLLANMKQYDAALEQDRKALAEFQEYAKADPQNAQLRQDLGRVRQQMGLTNFNRGQPALALEQLGLSLGNLEKLPDANNAQSYLGYAVLTDELWLGKAHVRLASSTSISREQAVQHCREAQAWFSKCLPGFEEIRDHGLPGYGGAERLAEIKSEVGRCEQALKRNPKTPKLR